MLYYSRRRSKRSILKRGESSGHDGYVNNTVIICFVTIAGLNPPKAEYYRKPASLEIILYVSYV